MDVITMCGLDGYSFNPCSHSLNPLFNLTQQQTLFDDVILR